MRQATAVLFLMVILSSCSDVSDPRRAGLASITLTISSSEPMMSAGDTRTVTAVVKDARQSIIESPDLAWSTSAPGVASVSPSGRSATITAVGDGDAVITVASGSAQGTLTVSVRREIASILIESPASALVFGDPVQLAARALDARHNRIETVTGFTFSSSNDDVVAITPSGLALGLPNILDSTATITASVTRNGTTYSGTASLIARPRSPGSFDRLAVALTANVQPVRVQSLAYGVAYFSIRDTGLPYTFTWSKLSGPALEVHIHGPASDSELGDVLVDLAPPNPSGPFRSISGVVTAADIRSQGGRPPISMDSLVALMTTGKAYIDAHTSMYPGGEIRGQIGGPSAR